MDHINFLEKKGFDFRTIEFNTIFILIVCAAFLFFMIAYGVVQKIRLDGYQNELAAARSQTEVLQGMRQPSKANGTPTFSITSERRILWAHFLNALSAKRGEAIWIQSLSGLMESKTMEIEGKGIHWQAVHQFVRALESTSGFQKVSLLSSETGTDGKIVFKIRALLR